MALPQPIGPACLPACLDTCLAVVAVVSCLGRVWSATVASYDLFGLEENDDNDKAEAVMEQR